MKVRASLLLIVISSMSFAEVPRETSDVQILNARARYLAGLPQIFGSPLSNLAIEPAGLAHAKAMQQAWKQADSGRLNRMRAWSSRELSGPSKIKNRNIFYPFSGPDSLHVRNLYPGASTYILCGLEKVGALPRPELLDSGSRTLELAKLRESLTTSLNYSFFKTDDMKKDLKGRSLDGVLPILYTYAALMGDELKSIELMDLNEVGELKPAGSTASAVRIIFTSGGTPEPRSLIYFSWDLSNGGLEKRSGAFQKFVGKQGKTHTYLKSASYLMHSAWFSTIRGLILEGSYSVLQDDSGIPHRFFKDNLWTPTFYGSYNGPINKFKESGQPDLKIAYEKGHASILDFGVGYKYRAKDSNLVLYNLQERPK